MTAALTAAQLPSDIVTKLSIMRDGGVVSDRLEITAAGIHSLDYQRDFGYKVKAITMDGSMCFDSTINPPSSATGTADLYELVDAKRQRYSVMVVANGGNVAVLEMPGGRLRVLAASRYDARFRPCLTRAGSGPCSRRRHTSNDCSAGLSERATVSLRAPRSSPRSRR